MTFNISCFVQPLLVAAFVAFVCTHGVTRISGLRFELIHRDSPASPFYNPNVSRTDILRRAVARSALYKSYRVTPNSPMVSVFENEGSYLMKIRLGTPALDIIGAVDTGSHMVWTQCKSCSKCTPQRMPRFDPKASSTYKPVRCNEVSCPHGTKCGPRGVCYYVAAYNDKTTSIGVYSTDTMSVEDSINRKRRHQLPLYFGCGIEQTTRMSEESSGIFGLSPDPASFVSQLGRKGMNRMAFCLVPMALVDAVSHINFGEDAVVSGPGTVTLPLSYEPLYRNYLATLEAITIGATKIKVWSTFEADGNILLDTGTTVTRVTSRTFEAIRSALTKEIGRAPKHDPQSGLDLCFIKDRWFKYPIVVYHFKGGDMQFWMHNMWGVMGPDLVCLVMTGEDDLPILGNRAMSDFLIGIDYGTKTIKIKPQNCAS